ncbi:MAG: hypothetical protein WKG00_26375 [Polyangiaceae bacterium]
MTADEAPGKSRGRRVAAAPERLRLHIARVTTGEAPGSAAVPPPRPALTLLLEGEDGARGAGVAAPLGGDASAELHAAQGVLRAAAARLDETRPGAAASAPAGTTADVLDEVDALRCLLAPVAGLLRASAVARFALETAAARLLASRGGVTMAEVLRGAPRTARWASMRSSPLPIATRSPWPGASPPLGSRRSR